VSSYGDPHSKNIYGQRFDIKRPGNYSFLVLPRGADQGQQDLHVEATVTPKGDICEGLLYITGLKLTGRWLGAVGGSIQLYTVTDMYNSPAAVGLKVGNSSNMSLNEFAARIPEGMLDILRYNRSKPAKANTHVNTLTMRLYVGPSIVKVGWSHEKMRTGYANWLWLSVSGLGNVKNVGGLLGSDDHETVEKPSERAKHCKNEPNDDDAVTRRVRPPVFKSWAFAES